MNSTQITEMNLKRIELKIKIIELLCETKNYTMGSTGAIELSEGIMTLLEKQEILNNLRGEGENDVQ